jgi:flagellar basal-body rod protein FlgB
LPPGRAFAELQPPLRKLARVLLEALRTNVECVMSEGLFGIHGAALEIRAQRMGVLGSNIANAATPGYKARDIDFAAALEARMNGAGEEQSIGGATRYRVPVMPSLDGNTVEMATEQTAFAENAVAYTATLGFLRGRIETVTRAIRGE